jgi:hypothetical protein
LKGLIVMNTSLYNRDMMNDFDDLPCIFEKAICTNDPLSFLKDENQAQVFVENSFDFSQVLVWLPDNRFCLWHIYEEWTEQDDYLVCGFIDGHKAKIDKFCYRNKRTKTRNLSLAEHLAEYQGKIRNAIPFQFLGDRVLKKSIRNALEVIDCSYNSSKMWTDPDSVMDWFDKFSMSYGRGLELI